MSLNVSITSERMGRNNRLSGATFLSCTSDILATAEPNRVWPRLNHRSRCSGVGTQAYFWRKENTTMMRGLGVCATS